MKKLIYWFLAIFITNSVLAQQDSVDIFEMSLEELLNQKVIVASKSEESSFDAPGIISTISEEEIKQFPAKNLGELLTLIPGSQFLSSNFFTDNLVIMRGQSLTPYNNHVLILVNGRPLRDPISGGMNAAVYTAFPVELIAKIEVIRGPGSVLYGSAAFSGVINIITKKAKADEIEAVLKLDAGMEGEYAGAAGFLLNKNELQFGAGISFLSEEGPEYQFVDFSGANGSGHFGRKTFGLNTTLAYKGLSVSANYLYFNPFALQGADVIWKTPDPWREDMHRVFMSDIAYSRKLSEMVEVNANFTYNLHSWEIGISPDPQVGKDYLGELNARITPIEKMNIIIGATIEQDDYYGDVMIDNKTTIASIYSQFDYQLAKQAKIVAGIQWNKIENIEGNFSPRLGVLGQFNERFGYKLLYSTAFRKAYPLETSFDIPVFRGNLELKPELVATTELQTYYTSKKFTFALTGYLSNMSQIIVRNVYFTPEGNFDYLKYENGGTHNFMGLELEGKGTIGNDLFVTSSATYQANKNEAGTKDATLHPNFLAKVGVFYKKPSFSVGITNNFVSKPHPVSWLNHGVSVVNKAEAAYDLLSAKITLLPFEIINSSKKPDVEFVLEGFNLLNQDIRYPEYSSKTVNTLLPLSGGFFAKVSLVWTFTSK